MIVFILMIPGILALGVLVCIFMPYILKMVSCRRTKNSQNNLEENVYDEIGSVVYFEPISSANEIRSEVCHAIVIEEHSYYENTRVNQMTNDLPLQDENNSIPELAPFRNRECNSNYTSPFGCATYESITRSNDRKRCIHVHQKRPKWFEHDHGEYNDFNNKTPIMISNIFFSSPLEIYQDQISASKNFHMDVLESGFKKAGNHQKHQEKHDNENKAIAVSVKYFDSLPLRPPRRVKTKAIRELPLSMQQTCRNVLHDLQPFTKSNRSSENKLYNKIMNKELKLGLKHTTLDQENELKEENTCVLLTGCFEGTSIQRNLENEFIDPYLFMKPVKKNMNSGKSNIEKIISSPIKLDQSKYSIVPSIISISFQENQEMYVQLMEPKEKEYTNISAVLCEKITVEDENHQLVMRPPRKARKHVDTGPYMTMFSVQRQTNRYRNCPIKPNFTRKTEQ